jgi:hypothetical protein
MASCYKAIIEGHACYVSGWATTGNLRLANGSEIAMTPLDHPRRLTGKIWRIARLKRGTTDWLIDGENLSYTLNRPGALPNWPNTQYHRALRMLSEMLNVGPGSSYPSFGPTVSTKVLQSAVEKKMSRLQKLRRVVAVAFADSNIVRGLERFSIPTTNLFERRNERMLVTPPPPFIPILLTRFDIIANEVTSSTENQIQKKFDGLQEAGTTTPKLNLIKPPEINETILWHYQQKIQDELDIHLKSAPSASHIFVLYCRDRMKLADIHRKYGWSLRTIKARKARLRDYLLRAGLTLELFFVDRSIFAAAERQLRDHRAKTISLVALDD